MPETPVDDIILSNDFIENESQESEFSFFNDATNL